MSAASRDLGYYRWDADALVLKLRVQPRAKSDALASPVGSKDGNRLKVRITAPPVDGKANAHLCAYLAKVCGVPGSQVSLQQGESSRDKTLRIERPTRLPEGVVR